jgi:ubiquinone/menaquinone biosynthesis C-methylase UbiE
MMHNSTLKAYDIIAEDYKQRNLGPFYSPEIQLFSTLINSNSSLLEVGCGTGRDALELVQICGEYTGLDGSTGMLALAKEVLPSARFEIGNFMELPYNKESFDACWCASTLLHCNRSEIEKPVQEIYRILKPDGTAFISMRKKIDIDEHTKPIIGTSEDRYFAYYTIEEFANIAESAGFKILQVHEKPEPIEAEKVWVCYFLKKEHY